MILLAAVLSVLTPEARDSLLAETPGNAVFWSEALSSGRGEMLSCMEELFSTIPRLDRLEMNSEALMDHVIGALDSRDSWVDSMPDSLFMDFLLQYRFDDEPVTAYRTPLMTHWNARLADSDTTLAAVVERVRWSIGTMRVRQPDIMGGVAGPRDVLASGGGTPVELRVLLGSSLRSLGIPVRAVLGWFQGTAGREGGWLEYWDGAGWIPVPLPSDSLPAGFDGLSLAVAGDEYVTSELVPTGTISFSPVEGPSDSLLLAVSIPCPGRYVPLDWVELDPSLPCSIEVGEGSYMVHLSRRLPTGGVRFASAPAGVTAGGVFEMRLADMELEL
ncbi:MAG: transglutaminase-like domain-containing protein [Candidatus Fermentibacter sp.]|nr:transglutaminase-like domain-containing protein [Candidatus Fermentibacter sp.]